MDGFALIKTLYRPNYKYNLDEFLSFDIKEKHRQYKESAEIILKSVLPLNGESVKDPS